MSPTVFAAIPWGNRTRIWMKDITQPAMLDNSVYGWPTTLMPDGINFFTVGGFAFSIWTDIGGSPLIYFGFDNKLAVVTHPSNSWRIIIANGFDGNPVHLDVQNNGINDTIYFCTRDGYHKNFYASNLQEKMLNFNKNDWNIKSDDEIDVCQWLPSTNRLILIVRDKVGVWGLTAGVWTELFTPKKRFWYNYKVRVMELGTNGHFILYAKHAFMVLDSANLDAVHVWNREWD
jgi:hypothetical protein